MPKDDLFTRVFSVTTPLIGERRVKPPRDCYSCSVGQIYLRESYLDEACGLALQSFNYTLLPE